MLDLVVKGGVLVDGTGAPRRRADVGVRDGRVVAIGDVDDRATRTVDADGLVVAPGFVDIHTHYDAQVLWDPALTPSSLHGTTTVVAGNCGFTLAPISQDHADYVTRMLAVVEGMPLDALRSAVSYDWKSFGDYLARIDGNVGVNIGFLVGHSTLRRVVMGDDATAQRATAEQIDEMRRLLSESIEAGGLGLSSSFGEDHYDGDGSPVPSRFASVDELIELAAVVGEHEGTTLEFLPGLGPEMPTSERLDILVGMSAAANRPINWNVITINLNRGDGVWRTLDRIALAAVQQGARVVSLASCGSGRIYLSFKTGLFFNSIPGWAEIMTLQPDAKLQAMREPAVRDRMLAAGRDWPRRDWGEMTVTGTRRNRQYEGRLVGQLAVEQRRHPLDTIYDIVVDDDLAPILLTAPPVGAGDQDDVWQLRSDVWRDPRVLVGASDAGAHLDMLTSFTYGTSVVGAARDHQLMDLETAVNLVADRPARLYGLRGRGRVAEGAYADLVVFDPDRVGPRAAEFRNDLPAGEGRLYAEANGMHHVFVNGREIVHENTLTGELPGMVLRPEIDTATVNAR